MEKVRVKLGHTGEFETSFIGKNYFQQKTCPFSNKVCRSSCALFKEPEIKRRKVILSLCKTTIIVELKNFKDERWHK